MFEMKRGGVRINLRRRQNFSFAEDVSDETDAGGRASGKAVRQTKRVTIIDSDATSQFSLARLLRRTGCPLRESLSLTAVLQAKFNQFPATIRRISDSSDAVICSPDMVGS